MSEPNTIRINDVDYVRKDAVPKTTGDIRIVILQRGWVMIGYYSQKGEQCRLDKAYVIRVWGTTRGIGELALEGKKSGTKLDPCGVAEFHELTVIASINCVREKWESIL